MWITAHEPTCTPLHTDCPPKGLQAIPSTWQMEQVAETTCRSQKKIRSYYSVPVTILGALPKNKQTNKNQLILPLQQTMKAKTTVSYTSLITWVLHREVSESAQRHSDSEWLIVVLSLCRGHTLTELHAIQVTFHSDFMDNTHLP